MNLPRRNWRCFLALAVVAATEVGLFADSLERRWRQLPSLGQPEEKSSEGLVIRGNGLGYYAWLRSLLLDGDWSFDNEFDYHAVPGEYVPPRTYRTELDRRANQWSVGPACVWAITIVPAHYFLVALGDWSPWPANGYSLPYQLLAGSTSVCAAVGGLAFLYGVCVQFARPTRAALAAALLTLGSTIVYYSSVEVTMAHGLGATFLAAFVWAWLKSYGSLRWLRWFALGLLAGAMCLLRWQLAVFAVLPLGEALFLQRRLQNVRGTWLLRLAGLGAGVALAFLPQMIAWRCVYGHWFVEPIPQVVHHWLNPSLGEVLLYQDRSLFYWTPLCAVAFLGYFVGRPTANPEQAVLLCLAFVLEVYALASVWGQGPYLKEHGNYGGAFLSRSYGMRHLTEAVVVLGPGLAMLFERASRVPLGMLVAAAFVLTGWNLLLVCQYSDGFLPLYSGCDLQTLASQTLRYVQADPIRPVILVEVLGLLGVVLLWQMKPVGDSPVAASLLESRIRV